MKLLVCGDRHWVDQEFILEAIKKVSPELVIEGGAPGADTLARIAASRLKIPVVEFKAEWNTYGRAAGPIRNIKMLVEGKPDLVVAFHDDIKNSKGTKHMLEEAKKRGIRTILLHH